MAGTLNPDVIQLRVLIDGSPARKELAELTQESIALKESLKGMKKGSDEAVAALGRMGEISKRQEELRKEIGLSALSLKELNAELGRARAAYNSATPNSQQWVQAKQRIDELTDARKNLTDQNRVDMAVWEQVRTQFQLAQMDTKQLGLETKRLQAALASPHLGAAERAQLSAQLAAVKDRTEQLTNANRIAADAWAEQRKGITLTRMNMEQLAKEAAFLKTKLQTMDPDDPALATTRRELTAVQNRMASLQSGLGPFGRAWQMVKVQVASAGAVIGAMFAGGAIMSGIRNLISGAADYSDSIADVRKTTGLAQETVRQLGLEFAKWDTRTPRKELMELARDAGKLGLSAREDITAFVRAGNQIRVALGEDLGDDAIKNIGKLVDIFNLKDEFGLEKAMLKVGSAINELGMSSTASEGYMVEFIKRMGGIAPLANITMDQTLALGATLDSLGQTSEVSSTALSKLFLKMAQNYTEYARIAGMSAESFKELMNTNALEAFIRVLEKAGSSANGITALTETLGDMGVDGSRAVGVLGALANNTERLREQMVISRRAFEQGTSVTQEYDIKNNNLAATLEKLRREFVRLFTSNEVMTFLEGAVDAARGVVAWVKDNIGAIAFLAKVLASAGVAWATYNTVLGASSAAARINALMTTGLTKALVLLRIQKAADTVTTAANTTATQAATAATEAATVASKGLNAALKANPWGLLIAGVTTAYTLLAGFKKSADELVPSLRDLGEQDRQSAKDMYALYFQILATNKGTTERKDLIEKLKALYPDLLGNINAETVSNQELSKSIEKVNAQLIQKAILQRKDNANEKLREDAAKGFEAYENRVRTSMQRLTDITSQYGVDLAAIMDQAATPVEGMQTALEKVKQTAKFQEGLGFGGFGPSNEAEARIRGAIRDVQHFYDEYKKLEEAALQGEKERARMLQEQTGGVVAAEGQQLQAHKMTLAEVEAQLADLRKKLSEQPADSPAANMLAAEITRLEAMRAQLAGSGAEVVRTVEVIDNEIKALKERRDKESGDSAAYKRFTAQITALEKERTRITGEEQGKRAAKAKENLDELQRQYRAFQAQLQAGQISADEKEIAELDAKHAEELRKVKEQQAKLMAARKLTPQQAQTDLAGLAARQADERAELIGTQGDKRLAAMAEQDRKIRAALDQEHNAALQADVDFHARQLEEARNAAKEVRQIAQDHRDAQLKLYEQNAVDLIAQESKKWDGLIAEAKKRVQAFDEATAKAGVEPTEEILAERKKLTDGLAQLEQAKATVLKRINDKRRQEERDAERRFTMEMREQAVRRLQHFATVANGFNELMGGIVQNMDVTTQVAEANADADGVRTEAEIANINRLKEERRQAALTALVVQGAAAIASGVANAFAPGTPWPVAVAQGLATVGIVLGLIAQARALLNQGSGSSTASQRPSQSGPEAVPLGAEGLQARDGRAVTAADGGAVLDGPSHAGGGMDVYGRDGRPVANVEGGELMLILSRASTRANADLIPAMLRASREGKRLDFFAPPPPVNLRRVQQAMRVVHMRDGGFAGTPPPAPSGSEASAFYAGMLSLMQQMVQQQAQANEGIRQFPTTLKATVQLNPQYDRTMQRWQDLKDMHKAS